MPQEQDPDDSIQTLMDVIAALELSPGAQAQLSTFIKSLTDRSKSQFEPFLTFLLQYIEYNRSKYLQISTELNAASQDIQTLKTDLQQFLVTYRNVIAASPADARVPLVAQPARPTEMPFVAPHARQAEIPFVAQPASRPQPGPVADGLLKVNVDGTVSRKMDQVGNNVTQPLRQDREERKKEVPPKIS